MPVFVHLTPQRNLTAIRRGGIGLIKRRVRPAGVYALPVTQNFYISHQWLRELRRLGGGTIAGVYFRLPDDEMVEVGHYDSLHCRMTAAEAVALMMAAEKNAPEAARADDLKTKAVVQRRKLPSSPEGFEVIIPRRIAPAEILRVKALPQVVGWRHKPGAHGTPPCACMCCERGQYGARKLLRSVEAAEAKERTPKATLFGRDDKSARRVARMAEARRSGSQT